MALQIKAFIWLLLVPVNSLFAETETVVTDDWFWLVVYVGLALGVSFLCSIAEAVLLSITPSYIVGLKHKRPKRAAMLEELKHDNIDQSLAAILTLNTIAHTVGAIGAGAKAIIVFGNAWFGVFSAVMTLLILFLSEIVPKTIGAIYWAQLAQPMAYIVKGLIFLLYPIVWISEKITRLISGGKSLHIFSHDELIAMAKVGEQTGTIEDKESQIIHNLFRFRSLRTKDIMTPRTVVSALPEDLTVEEALAKVSDNTFSRLPVYGDDIDDVTGVVLKDDILLYNAKKQNQFKLKTIKRDMIAVPGSASLSSLLEQFLKERQHIAVVVDEYGATKGLVTLEDLVETLIGIEIVDETDNVEDMQNLARRQWAQRAKVLGIKDDSATED